MPSPKITMRLPDYECRTVYEIHADSRQQLMSIVGRIAVSTGHVEGSPSHFPHPGWGEL